ncbi:MAG: tetratricopeptide repeat protein [Candidatus Magnetomorum sp.]|nr:tetratricopeptide repeat protein [Candidatus Magnetomorum sp.]
MALAKNAEEYIERQRSALAMNPDCGTTRYNLAVALLGQKKYDEAEREFKEAVANSPSLAEAYVQLGGICLQRGDLDGCLAYNEYAVNARAGFSIGYGNIAFVHLQKGEPDKAIVALNKAIAFNEKFIQAYSSLSSAYFMNGELDKSIESAKKAISLEPNFAIAYHNLSLALFEKGEHEKAIENCDKAIALGYDVPSGYLQELASYRSSDK